MTLEEAKKVKRYYVLYNRAYDCDFVVDKVKEIGDDIKFLGYFVMGNVNTWDTVSYMDLIIK